MQPVASDTRGADDAVHLLITNGELELVAEDVERVMERINVRATQFRRVLEDVLHEPHGEPHWGIND